MLDHWSSMAYPTGMSSRVRLSEQLRRAVRDASISRYELSQRTGIDQSLLSRFLSGTSGLSLDSLDLIASELDLHLVAGKPRRTRSK